MLHDSRLALAHGMCDLKLGAENTLSALGSGQ